MILSRECSHPHFVGEESRHREVTSRGWKVAEQAFSAGLSCSQPGQVQLLLLLRPMTAAVALCCLPESSERPGLAQGLLSVCLKSGGIDTPPCRDDRGADVCLAPPLWLNPRHLPGWLYSESLWNPLSSRKGSWSVVRLAK